MAGSAAPATPAVPAGPATLRLAFYGDDFTGSTDALEVLAFAGLRCALFLDVPDARTLAALGPLDAIGVAGDSRGMSPGEMDERLPAVFSRLAALPVPLVHYKVCSTFDSSPAIGSIGRVMELAREAFGPHWIPVVAATPALARYCAFGNLFARAATDGRVHRIDRHPIMSVHPVTPMGEADLVRHLGAQTRLPIANLALPHVQAGAEAVAREAARLAGEGAAAVLLDGTEPAHLTAVGRLLDALAPAGGPPRFAVGSSGLEYALTQWWRASGTLPCEADAETASDAEDAAVAASGAGAAAEDASRYDRFDAVPQVLAVSGSASALSALQIDAAVAAGFEDIAVDAARLTAASDWEHALEALAARAAAALHAGRSVMLHTARGAADPRIEAMLAALQAQGLPRDTARHAGGRLLGERLGLLVERLLREVPLRRLLLSGGDTSSQITRVLAPQALRIEARLAPGAPLCRVLSDRPHLRDLQVALKGGQMGQADYFVRALRGSAAHR